MLQKISLAPNKGFLGAAKKSDSMSLSINGKPIIDGSYDMKNYYVRLKKNKIANTPDTTAAN